MVNLARYFPLPFVAEHHAYTPGVENEWGNTVPGHVEPVSVPCIWWTPSSDEPPSGNVNSDRVVADVVLALDSAVQVDSRDYFTIDAFPAVRLDVVGLPKDYDHGPWGFSPGRRIVELKAVLG